MNIKKFIRNSIISLALLFGGWNLGLGSIAPGANVEGVHVFTCINQNVPMNWFIIYDLSNTNNVVGLSDPGMKISMIGKTIDLTAIENSFLVYLRNLAPNLTIDEIRDAERYQHFYCPGPEAITHAVELKEKLSKNNTYF